MIEDVAVNKSHSPVSSSPITDEIETYGLATENPFDEEQNQMSDFFEGGERLELLEEANHLCQFGNNIVLISGDSGVGKTFFLEQACIDLSESAICCFISASSETRNEDIAKDIATELSIPFQDNQRIEDLVVKIKDIQTIDNIPRFIVIIDDLDQLHPDIIFELLDSSQGVIDSLHLLASSSSHASGFLSHIALDERLIREINLTPYNLAQTKEYLAFKMSSAGYKGDDFFDVDVIKKIYRDTGGYPGHINSVAEKILYSQDINEKSSPRAPGLPLLHMGGIVFLLFALILAFFYGGELLGNKETSTDEQILTLPINSEGQTSIEAEVTETETTAAEQINDPVALPTTSPESITESNTQDSQALASPEESLQSTIEGVNSPKLETIIESVQDTVSTIPPITPTNAETAESVQASTIEKANVATSTPKATSLPATPSNQSTAERQTEIEASSTAPRYSSNEQAVLGWPDADVTIQVIGALDKSSLEKYITAQPNRDQLALITLLRDGKPWHIVVTGYYKTNNDAKAAIQNLPQNQVNSSPWIRKIEDLKQQIKDFRSN